MNARPRRIATGTIANLRDRVTGEGVEAAYEALVGVCRDAKAPAQARATAATTLFRAAGMLESFEDDGAEKDASEMTSEELHRFIRRQEARLDALDREQVALKEDDEGSILI